MKSNSLTKLKPLSELIIFEHVSIKKINYLLISEEAKRLKEQGVNIIIALGHSGLERDKQIAHECHDIDLVIGGHCKFYHSNCIVIQFHREL